MTDNEKAATFIGWKPNECAPPIPKTARTKMYAGIVYSRADYIARFAIRAPDMSDPRNYMKALEHPSISSFTIRYERAPGELDDQPAHWLCWIIYGDWTDPSGTHHARDVSGVGMVRADTIIKALAALYDVKRNVANMEGKA